MKSVSFKGARDGLKLDDNDIDSAICALTALAATQKRQSHILYGDKLDKKSAKNDLIRVRSRRAILCEVQGVMSYWMNLTGLKQ